MGEKIEIPISKTKILFLIFICVIFIIGSIGSQFTDVQIYNKVILGICGAFFIFGFIVLVKNVFKNDQTIVIDEFGITDNVTKPHVGLIEWADITHAEIGRIATNKMLFIHVTDPEKYLSRVTARGLRNNYNMVGTPFVIPSSMLKIKLSDLEKIINRRVAQYNEQNKRI